jgi:ABC-type glycerol-3-phosphate transport system permease component
MFKSLERKSFGEKVLYIAVSALFMVVALSYIYILVWCLISACKTHTEIVMDPFSLPKTWYFEHFSEMFQKLQVNGSGFGKMLFNSLWFSLVGTLLTQFCSVTFAYCVAKYEFPGSKWVYPIFMVVLTLPLFGSSGAQYKLYHNLGLINNYLQILTAYSALSVYTMYYMAYFKNFSGVYSEAGRMDGANDFQIYFKIILPQAKPMFGAMFLTQWITVWNSYETALVYIPKLPTLPVGIYQFNQDMIYQMRLDILFAACLVVVLPALILFVAFNKTITSNVSAGGIKG